MFPHCVNLTEIRVDAWKLCQLMRRAEPRSAEDIGTWQAILEITSVFAIFINSGLVAFTATNMTNYQFPMRVWTFILMSGGIFALRNFIAAVIPDTPPWVEIQVQCAVQSCVVVVALVLLVIRCHRITFVSRTKLFWFHFRGLMCTVAQ